MVVLIVCRIIYCSFFRIMLAEVASFFYIAFYPGVLIISNEYF
jgi:hypothetical protein